MTDEAGYVVAVKPSARRASAAAGRWVNREGPIRRFPGRPAAESWARECSTDAALVYVRDANPGDESADGYLMAVRRTALAGAEGGDEPDEEREQAGFARYRRQRDDQSGLEQFDAF